MLLDAGAAPLLETVLESGSGEGPESRCGIRDKHSIRVMV